MSFQELATRVSHRNTGKLTGDAVADQLLARVAADENLHMVFYRNLLGAALELDPNQTMRAITDVVKTFPMPGADIAGFQRKAVEMAIAGVYDIRQHRDDVVAPVLRFWKVFELEGLDAEGEQARTELADFMAELEKQALRFEDKRDALKARMRPARRSSPARRGPPLPRRPVLRRQLCRGVPFCGAGGAEASRPAGPSGSPPLAHRRPHRPVQRPAPLPLTTTAPTHPTTPPTTTPTATSPSTDAREPAPRVRETATRPHRGRSTDLRRLAPRHPRLVCRQGPPHFECG